MYDLRQKMQGMKDGSERRIRSNHGDVSLEDMAALLPGTGDVMAVVSRLYGNLWHAALGGNWELAAFYFRRTRTQLRNLAVTRPKYADRLRDYQREHLEVVGRALAARDLPAFREAYLASVERANSLHVETGYPYIHWEAPEKAPDQGLELGPIPPVS